VSQRPRRGLGRRREPRGTEARDYAAGRYGDAYHGRAHDGGQAGQTSYGYADDESEYGYETDYDQGTQHRYEAEYDYEAEYGYEAEDEDRVRRVRVITPGRIVLFLLLLAAAALAVYGIILNPQLPLAVSGLAVLGVALGLLAISLAGATAQLGRAGFGGRALWAALVGGSFAIAACGALAGAIVLGLIAAAN
jgi:hypothetical protein